MIYNPITKQPSPDPFIAYDEETEYYYCMHTAHNIVNGEKRSALKLSRAKNVSDVVDGEYMIILTQGEGEHGIYFNMWAPELFKANDGKWYIYASGFTEPKIVWNSLKIFVLRSRTNNPFDGFEFIKEFDELSCAFDATVCTLQDGKTYMCYSQNMYAYGFTHYEQRLFIREMRSPTELGDKFAEISKADMPFELSKPNEKINEGPFFVHNQNKLFIVYSANGCGNEDYCLGILEYIGGEICNHTSWKKHDQPLLYKSDTLFGPGHASFFYSPDKTELWCAFHAILDLNDNQTFKTRFACINKVHFDSNGFPMMGKARDNEPSTTSIEK